MNRVLASIVWAGLALGCQTDDTLSSTDQALTCKPETPFCDAEMPPTKVWKKGDQAPKVSEKSHAILFDLGKGKMLAMLSDYEQGGKVVWARIVDKLELGAFIDFAGINVAIDIRRPPPRGPVGPGGGDWNAIFALEFGVRALPISEQASDALDKY